MRDLSCAQMKIVLISWVCIEPHTWLEHLIWTDMLVHPEKVHYYLRGYLGGKGRGWMWAGISQACKTLNMVPEELASTLRWMFYMWYGRTVDSWGREKLTRVKNSFDPHSMSLNLISMIAWVATIASCYQGWLCKRPCNSLFLLMSLRSSSSTVEPQEHWQQARHSGP